MRAPNWENQIDILIDSRAVNLPCVVVVAAVVVVLVVNDLVVVVAGSRGGARILLLQRRSNYLVANVRYEKKQ